MRAQPFLELHSHPSASHGPHAGPWSLFHTDTLQKPAWGSVLLLWKTPASFPALLPAYTNSSHFPPSPHKQSLTWKMQTTAMEHPAQAFCHTSPLSYWNQFPVSRGVSPICVQCSSFRERSWRWGQVIHSTFLPTSTEQPGKYSGAALSLPEPEALSVPAFSSCPQLALLPPQRPLSPPTGGPRPPVLSPSSEKASLPSFTPALLCSWTSSCRSFSRGTFQEKACNTLSSL